MKRLSKVVVLAGVAGAFLLSANQLQAQADGGGGGGGARRGGGNVDREQMRQEMMKNLREQFQVKDDAEWKILEERITKVTDARREVGFGGGGMRRMFRPPGGDRPAGGDNQADQGNRRRFGPEPSAEEQALEKAIESKASKEELKAAMTKYRESRKQKEAKLQQAQEELKKVLNVQQEAVALSMGLVN